MSNKQSQLEILYHEYGIQVYNLALNYVQNVEDAEEVTQDVFLKIYESYSQFEQKSTLKTWIYRITINKSLDFIKMKNCQKRFFIFGKKSQNDQEYINTATFEHPGILMEKQEEAAILFKVINTLTENQKTVFLLSKLDGFSNPEIAAILQISISAVESLIYRAKAALQDKLSEKFKTYRKK